MVARAAARRRVCSSLRRMRGLASVAPPVPAGVSGYAKPLDAGVSVGCQVNGFRVRAAAQGRFSPFVYSGEQGWARSMCQRVTEHAKFSCLGKTKHLLPITLQTFGGVVVVHAASRSHARWRACGDGRRLAARLCRCARKSAYAASVRQSIAARAAGVAARASNLSPSRLAVYRVASSPSPSRFPA